MNILHALCCSASSADGSWLGRRAQDAGLKRLQVSAQDMTLGPEVARHFADALTLLYRREGNPVDAATIVGTDLVGLVRLQEVRPRGENIALSV